MPLILSSAQNGEAMKRESYKKGPRFGPDAWDYRDETPAVKSVEEVIKQPVEEVVKQQVTEVVEEVVKQPVEEVSVTKPVVEPVVTTQDTKSVDKKKK